MLLLFLAGCTTLPEPKFKKYAFPADAHVNAPANRRYESIGTVRAKADFPSLDPYREETELCANYYNRAVADLVKFAREKKADAVVDVRSVTFYENGQVELHAKPECSDEGAEGQVLVQGTAVKWLDPSPGASR